jgi:hypothetical protein
MSPPARRTILRSSPAARRELGELLQAIATAELLRPSRRLWVASPVLADSPVLDNRAGGFTSLEPAWGERTIGLVDLLVRNLALGAEVAVVVGDGDEGQRFLARLRDAAEAAGVGARLSTRTVPAVTEAGIAGDEFHLAGRLAWSPSAVAIAEEGISFEAGEEAGQRAADRFRQVYGGGAP